MNNKDIYLIGEAYKKQVLEANNFINNNNENRPRTSAAKTETLRRYEQLYSNIPSEMVKSNPELKAQLAKLHEMCSELVETDDMDTHKIVDLSADIRDLIQDIQENL